MSDEIPDRLIFVGRDGKEVVSNLRSARQAGEKRKPPTPPTPAVSAGRKDAGSPAGEDLDIVFIDKAGKELFSVMRSQPARAEPAPKPQPKKKKQPPKAPIQLGGPELIFITTSGRELVGGYRAGRHEEEPEEPTRLQKVVRRLSRRREAQALRRLAIFLFSAPAIYLVLLITAMIVYSYLRTRELEYLQDVKAEALADIASRNVHKESVYFALTRLSPVHVTMRTSELTHEEIMTRLEAGQDVYQEYADVYFAQYNHLSERYRDRYEELRKKPVADFRGDF